MKKLSLKNLPYGKEHILSGIIPGQYLTKGRMGFKYPGQRSHDTGCDCNSCEGNGVHVHQEDSEVFIILQGKAVMQLDGDEHSLCAGDVVICEPGEEHHLIADEEAPCVNIYLHAGDKRNPQQKGNQ